MTMPHLMNCGHSNYGICKECADKFAPDDGWFLGIPPADCRTVVMRLRADGSDDDFGFYWSPEKRWYRRCGSKNRRAAVSPIAWKEVALAGEGGGDATGS